MANLLLKSLKVLVVIDNVFACFKLNENLLNKMIMYTDFSRLTVNTLGRESNYSHPPSYRSREGSVSHNPDAIPSSHPGGSIGPAHSRDPSCLSFLSHESIYSSGAPPSQEGSLRAAQLMERDKFAVVEDAVSVIPPSKKDGLRKDDNTVTIVQTTDSSQVIGSDAVVVTVSGLHSSYVSSPPPQPTSSDAEISVLAHL